MQISSTHARILEERLQRRLRNIGARRIALLGAGQFLNELVMFFNRGNIFAGAEIVAIIDESKARSREFIAGIPVVGSADEPCCDAIVITTPMHEPSILRRASAGAFGVMPVFGMHTVADPSELDADVLILPEAAWFGLDLPGLLVKAGKSYTIASATGLPGFDATDTSSFWDANRNEPLENLEWEGIELFEFVRGSATCLLGRIDFDPVAEWETVVALMDESIRIFESANRCFASGNSPGIVVVANGLFHHQRAVAEAASRCGKQVVVIESSCFPGLCRLELWDQISSDGSSRDRLRQKNFTTAQRVRTELYLSSRKPHMEQRIDSASQPEPMNLNAIRWQLEIPDDHRVLLLLGQVCTDTSLVYQAPLINDIPRLARLAAAVIAETPGWTLLIKPHPKETTGSDPISGRPYQNGAYSRLLNDPVVEQPNIRLLEPAAQNVYDLMQLADAGLSINSQSALEMISMYAKPVCLVGRASFAGTGITRDVVSRAMFESTLRRMLADPALKPGEHDCALHYVDHAVFERLIPTDLRTPAEALKRVNDAVPVLFAKRHLNIVSETPGHSVHLQL